MMSLRRMGRGSIPSAIPDSTSDPTAGVATNTAPSVNTKLYMKVMSTTSVPARIFVSIGEHS
ncbi:hypothetical protein D3C83_255950 [compost metagenome]